jgi:hypothetical protein
VLGAIFEFDKALTVAKLRGARERKRRDMGECEGRKSHAERSPSSRGHDQGATPYVRYSEMASTA